MAVPEGYTPLAKIGINYKGEYVSETTYSQLDAVYYNGSTYLALIDSPAGIPTSDGVNWRYLAKGTAETIIESYTDMMANEVAGYLADALAVKAGFDIVNSGLDNKDFVREKSGNAKLSFKWTTYEDGVFYLGGYIGDVEVVKLRQGFDSKMLRGVKRYPVTKDTEVMSDGSIDILRYGEFYHIGASVYLTVDEIAGWGEIQIGTISNWTGETITIACVLNAFGYSDLPSLGLTIKEDGSIYVKTHGAVSGIKGIWFYGRSTVYTAATV